MLQASAMNPRGVRAEITFDLAMDDDMPFVEDCYRMDGGEWRVFIFSRERNGASAVGVRKDVAWRRG